MDSHPKPTFSTFFLSWASPSVQANPSFVNVGEPVQPKFGKKPEMGILGQFWAVWKRRVEPAQPEIFKKIGLSRLDSIFFSTRICYVFLILKCRGESDVGLCMSSVLAKRMPLHSADFRQILRPNTFTNRKSALRSGIFFASTEPMHRHRSDSNLHFDLWNS